MKKLNKYIHDMTWTCACVLCCVTFLWIIFLTILVKLIIILKMVFQCCNLLHTISLDMVQGKTATTKTYIQRFIYHAVIQQMPYQTADGFYLNKVHVLSLVSANIHPLPMHTESFIGENLLWNVTFVINI